MNKFGKEVPDDNADKIGSWVGELETAGAFRPKSSPRRVK